MVTNIFVSKIFNNRKDAGQFLAGKLAQYRNRNDVVVLGLPRGGVPVAYEVAKALNAPLDIFLVKNLGVPGFEEYARLYRGAHNPLDVTGQTVILVDDGMATGSTMRAAVRALRKRNPGKIVIAVPVGAREACNSFNREVDTVVVCGMTPEPFKAIGILYRNFAETTDAEVQQLLSQTWHAKAAA